MFENRNVERLYELASRCAVAGPAEAGTEQMKARYSDAQRHLHARLGKVFDPESFRRKVLEVSRFPGARGSLPHFAPY